MIAFHTLLSYHCPSYSCKFNVEDDKIAYLHLFCRPYMFIDGL